MEVEQVILVDENDQAIGTAEKLEAHQKGLRHRAFSVFIFRREPQWELLLQQRAAGKYHSPNLWTNTCCSHPRPDEDIITAAERRLQEEMGMIMSLKTIGRFHYIAHFDNGLTENEMDHVLVGEANQAVIHANPEEVQAYRWITPVALEKEVEITPKQFTPWLKPALEMVKRFLLAQR